MVYLEYSLTSECLCIGDRIKKGTFRPCIKTIPYSTITGSLREKFNRPDIFAAGKLDSEYLNNIVNFKNIHVYSPRYRVEDVAKVPLKLEFLVDVQAKVFIYIKDGNPEDFVNKHENFDVIMGAFKTKGFGRCNLKFLRPIENHKIISGKLQTRIPVPTSMLPVPPNSTAPEVPNHFGIGKIKKPVYGYLPEPIDKFNCRYVLSVFEGSIIEGYDFLVEK